MAKIRTVDLLPEIFQTPVNRQFLAGTVDQLVQEPNFSTTQGFIGRRIGPGVNANDDYVIEPSVERANYQLEPGVIITNADRTQALDALTYPGILDALSLQGADVQRADRLFASDYYCWDPFVDYDKVVNFAEYYWVPAGPFAVTVSGEQIPYEATIQVTRSDGYYTFNYGSTQRNPTLTLVRGGSYDFTVNQNSVSTYSFRVTNRGSSAYLIDYQANPALKLIRGNTYQFNLNLGGEFPFYIKTQPGLGTTNQYTQGVVNNGSTQGQITFTVPYDAPDTLYYACSVSQTMQGQLDILDATPGTGPKFWIQADIGVDGVMRATPNISARDVLGVVNNGEDLGTVTFNVPVKTAQNFYYGLTEIAKVDLVSDIAFADINNVYVDGFFQTYPNGIDGVTDLNNRTVVFVDQSPLTDAEDALYYGWYRSQFYSPVPPSATVNQPGTYDQGGFSTDTPILLQSERYQVYEIVYQTGQDGVQYMELLPVQAVNALEKFQIASGNTHSNTQWYKNADGFFEQIPLLTAALDVLYYQDGQDPAMFGEIRLIDQTQDSTIFIEDILGKPNYTSPNGVVFTNGLVVQFQGSVVPASYVNNTYYVEGVGTSIVLLPTAEFATPETYTQSAVIPYDSRPFDIGNFDVDANQPSVPDYLTINRASQDRSPWSRSNRWFHRAVIEASAAYTGTTAVLNQELRAKRPILEFRAGMKLYDFGTQAKNPINVIDFTVTDAFSQVAGTQQYNIDGYQLVDGSRVIFAADSNAQVRNRIYTVTLITPDTQAPLIAQPVIALTPAQDAVPVYNQTLVCLSGLTLQGQSFWYDGLAWQSAQQKTQTNQAPLFDVYDRSGFSLSDPAKYPGTNFQGTRLFSYARGTGANDTVLNFPLQYLTISNVGDIVFANDLYTDTFLYVVNRASVETQVSTGMARQYTGIDTYVDLLGWQPADTQSHQYQQFRFNYDGSPLLLDIAIAPVPTRSGLATPPSLKVYVGSKFVPPQEYQVTVTANTTTIRLSNTYVANDVIEVLAYSNQVSAVGFYQIPTNLENNPFNANSASFTLGTVRTHYESICENLTALIGAINGSNNSRDLGNIVPYGETILQQSSPLTLSGLFLRQPEFNVFSALDYNNREYTKYKTLLLDTLSRHDYTGMTTAQALTQAISEITINKTDTYPFYWSDMLPAGAVYMTSTYTYTVISTPVFETHQTYDFTASNYLGLNVFVNDRLLTRGYEFTVADAAPRIEITVPLQAGDVIVIQEFASTVGSFCPNTPTKMGMYPAWRPEIYLDTSYADPTYIILGHDGSKTAAFGDFRDQVLLEFETRIFNNLKITSTIPIEPWDIMPGAFRTTDFSAAEVQNVFDGEFLSWIGWNKLDYTTQNFQARDEFTWNYGESGNRLTGTVLPGAWRGIYLQYYDTVTPNTTPWEMLGFTQEPTWWQQRYGPAPYTAGNLVLWDDLEAGRVADPAGFYVRPAFARPGLTQILPVSDTGELLSPFNSVVGAYDSMTFRRSWSTGDYGPTEYSWRASSSYPFAVMRLYAVCRSAEFFSLLADRDLYRYDDTLNQYLYDRRYRLDANGIEVYGLGVSKASFINWIVDYNAYLGNLTAAQALTLALKSLDVRLCYRMAGFSNKQYLKIFLEKPSPASVNASLLLPDSSVDLLLYKNQPFDATSYSSVIVQRDSDGYQVFGYSTAEPYFQILVSRPSGVLQTITAGGTTVRVPAQYTDRVVRVPYGFKFVNETVLVDFLLSYGKFLEARGLEFTSVENGLIMDWRQMAQEFLYWSNQGWGPGSLINLNPSAVELSVARPNAIVDNVIALGPENQIQDQNRQLVSAQNLIIERDNNQFRARSQNNQALSFVNMRFTAYEHMLVFRNQSVFGDLLYQPATGARQNRVRIQGAITNDWNGQLDAQGFVLNQDNIQEWVPNRKYTRGEIVLFKNNYWSALTIVQPKETFDFNDWAASDRAKIATGLLPNIPNKANQLANSYNINRANLESDNDLLSYGLIGFRPRQYMAALDLDDVSQVNVYREFIGDKGTLGSVRLLGNANFNKEAADYTVYENWAILSGVYGAQANRSYVDVRLDQALLTANPSIVQLVQPMATSTADQTVELRSVWSTSTVLTTPDYLPVVTGSLSDQSLPMAGYVNVNDVDIAVFDLDSPDALDVYLDQIGVGTSIWVARVNKYDWNVYRASRVNGAIVQVSDNLNGTSTVQFTAQHGLSQGDIVVIKYFDAQINGVYRVLAVPGLYSVTIAFVFAQGSQVTAQGQGLALRLEPQRVSEASQAVNLDYVASITQGGLIWVDNNGDNHWQVLEKTQPVTALASVYPDDDTVFNTRFAATVAQRADNLVALVGQPNQLGQIGAVCNYSTQGTGNYMTGQILNMQDAQDIRNYGASVAVGDLTTAVAGAPGSFGDQGAAAILTFDQVQGGFQESQMLVALDQPGPARFGASVDISEDQRWVYVGAPGVNAVYAYGLVGVQEQIQSYVVAAGQFQFSTGNIQFAQDGQLTVTYNDQEIILGHDYTVSGNLVSFAQAPVQGSTVTVSRRTRVQLDIQHFFGLVPDANTGLGTDAVFNIDLVRGNYVAYLSLDGISYSQGDILTILGTHFGGTTPANDCVITVDTVGALGEITAFTVSGSFVPVSGLATSFDITASLYAVTNIDSVTVRVDGVLQRPKIDYEVVPADSSLPVTPHQTQYLQFVNSPVQGAVIQVTGTSHYTWVHTLTVPGLDAQAEFGASVSVSTDGRQVMVGAPGQSQRAGAVYVFERTAEAVQIVNDNQTMVHTHAALIAPTTVRVNNVIVQNQDYYYNGAYSTGANTVTFAQALNVGDVVTVETNEFMLVQTLTSSQPAPKSEYGRALDLCRYNCSLYVGEPFQSAQLPQAGAVERSVNQARVYGIISSMVTNPVVNEHAWIRVNDYDIQVPDAADDALRLLALAQAITNTVPNVRATVNDQGILTITVVNTQASTPGNRLTVLPGSSGTLFQDLGFVVYAYTQTIVSPLAQDYAQFGAALNINTDSTVLTVGAPQGTLVMPTTFDSNATTFDANSTAFQDYSAGTGVVYTFDYMPAAQASVNNAGKFIFGQEIYDASVNESDAFGTSLDYRNNILLAGSPGRERSQTDANILGRMAVFVNADNVPAWQVRSQQRPAVDVHLINSVSMYDRLVSTTNQFFDFFDPSQGKVLGAAQRNIDYVGAQDPAVYNSQNRTPGNTWFAESLGKIWWDVSTVRFVDALAGDINYAARRWGQVTPGSQVHIYTWTQNSVPPVNYTGPGQVLNIQDYVISTQLGGQGIIETVYYYWVRGLTTVTPGKTLSPDMIARYIQDPVSSGVSYAAPVSPSAWALYNGQSYIRAADTILHVEYDQTANDDNVHTQYELIPQGKSSGFLTPRLYEKLVDSLSGISAQGLAVPDVNLPWAMRYGVANRPRQSMFQDRFAAGTNFVSFCNRVLAQYPVSELNLSFDLLNSSEPQPSSASGAWNVRVADLEQLAWQDIQIQPEGYRYLVESDSDNFGYWTIYTVIQPTGSVVKTLQLTRVQNYDTPQYWQYQDWYASDYAPSDLPVYEVAAYQDLASVSVPVGSTVKVTANSQNRWEIYRRSVTSWDRVGLQNGTIEISAGLFDYTQGRIGFDAEVFDTQYFDYSPELETRRIVQAINQELFINELAIYRNQLLTLLFNYILSEHEAPAWLTKTSLIDVDHRIRQLLPFQNYRRDNQDFVLDYIREVKPYHVQIRQFNLQYTGDDLFQGSLTDFDLPAFYDNAQAQYVSPILDYDGSFALEASAFAPDSEVWQAWPYNQWIQTYLLDLSEIIIESQGSGYVFAPTVVFSGQAQRLGTATVSIDSAGAVTAVNIIDAGQGYLTTPVITLVGGSGTGARLIPRMTHESVRTFNLGIKYDRYEYAQTFAPWQANTTYVTGDMVSYADRVWQANGPVASQEFNPANWILRPAGSLSGVDRTMGYYAPTPAIPGRVLPLLITGVDYPGVDIQAVPYDAQTGYDSDPYDSYPWDNIQTSPEGGSTYSDTILDNIYASAYLDSYLGTRPSDINVDGGAYVDAYESHAPEELVPGAEFDTLDLRVYTTPGADWLGLGHGFDINNLRSVWTQDQPSFSYAGISDFPVIVELANISQLRDLNEGLDYQVDYVQQVITVMNNPAVVSNNDVLTARVLSLGGGNQLSRTQYVGSDIGNHVMLDVNYAQIQELVVFVNGQNYTDFTYSALTQHVTDIVFGTTFTAQDRVSVVALGASPGTTVRSWSTAVTQLITVTNATQFTYAVTNSLQGTNPDNMIVTKNGVRLRPSQGADYLATGLTATFDLPIRGIDSQQYVTDPDVHVYVNGQPLTLGTDYTVSAWTGTETRSVTLAATPPAGSHVLVAVDTYSDYYIDESQIVFKPSSTFNLQAGDVIAMITWNDTSQQNLVTRLWRGPVQVGTGTVEGFDSTLYSEGNDFNSPGSFDYSASTISYVNDFDLARPAVEATRLWVHLNGRRLANGIGYTIEHTATTSMLVLPAVINTNDVVTVTMPTQSVVPGAMAFRIFQDMREFAQVFRMTQATTTTLAQPLGPWDDVMYVTHVQALGEPNPANNSWGVLTVNAERIMYRYYDAHTNSVYGLLRGTAGTAAAHHPAGSTVYDMNSNNLLPLAYQNYVVSDSVIADGQTQVFAAADIDLSMTDSTENAQALRVIVGGQILSDTEYVLDLASPATVTILQTPPQGVQVTLAVQRGSSWYQPGINEPSDGRPLQLTDTLPARFLRGL